MSREDYDVVVVGGSWAGLAAAIRRARRRVLVVDAGRPRNRFAQASHGFLGQDGRSPAAILDTFRTQVLAYPTVEFQAGDAVAARSDDDRGFAVDLASGDTVRARGLILATGLVDELPNIPGLAERWGVTVLHCPYCHGYEVADGLLGILAGGERSMHLALLLPDWSADVTLFTNGAFDPDGDQQAALAARGVRIETRPMEAMVGVAPELAGVRLQGGEVVELDALFVATRTHMASPLAEQLGCAFDDGPSGPIIRTDARKETTVPGVFAAGDAARVPSTATLAAADGAIAGVSLHQALAMSQASLLPR